MPGKINLYLCDFWVVDITEDFAGRITSSWSRVYPDKLGKYPEEIWRCFPNTSQPPPIKFKLDYVGKVVYNNRLRPIKIVEPEGKTFVFHSPDFNKYEKYRVNDRLSIVIPTEYSG